MSASAGAVKPAAAGERAGAMGATMRRIAMRWPAASGAVLIALLSIAPAPAQQPAPAQRPQPLPAPPAKAAAPRDGAQTSESALRQRIEQLEEQLVDMQVVVGTLETLARGAPAPMGAAPSGARPNAGAAAALNAADAGRLEAVETSRSSPRLQPALPHARGGGSDR